jgi:GAF domain-containing protein
MTAPEPNVTDTTAGLAQIAGRLDVLAERLGVKSVLVMRSDPDAMVVAATAGEATKHYTVGAAGRKAGGDADRVPLYCERIVDTDAPLFVRDSREDATFAGNEDEVEFGLSNYLGVAVHDESGAVLGTVCVLDDGPRDYTDEQRAELESLRDDVEQIVRRDSGALG